MLSLNTSMLPTEEAVTDGYTTVIGDSSTDSRSDDFTSSSPNVTLDSSGPIIGNNVVAVLLDISFICGAFFNVLAFLIWQRKGIRNMAGSLFLKCLCLCDALVLLITFIDFKIYNSSIYMYAQYTIVNTSLSLVYYSKYILVGICLERFVAVFFPLRVHLLISTKKSLFFLGISFLLATVPTFIMDFRSYCNACLWYEITQNSLLGILVVACNLAIIIQLALTAKKRAAIQVQNQQKIDKKVSSTTVMLLTVSLGYILLTFPFHIMDLLVNVFGVSLQLGHIWVEIFLLMYFNNHSCNFLLFYFSGTAFRRETNMVFLQIFSCGRRNVQLESRKETTTSTKTKTKSAENENDEQVGVKSSMSAEKETDEQDKIGMDQQEGKQQHTIKF